MKWWNLIPSELTLAKVVISLTLFMLAYLILVPHEPWVGIVALATIATGVVTTMVVIVAWMRRGLR